MSCACCRTMGSTLPRAVTVKSATALASATPMITMPRIRSSSPTPPWLPARALVDIAASRLDDERDAVVEDDGLVHAGNAEQIEGGGRRRRPERGRRRESPAVLGIDHIGADAAAGRRQIGV